MSDRSSVTAMVRGVGAWRRLPVRRSTVGRRPRALLLAGVAIAALPMAGAAQFKSLGFSPDGRFYAFAALWEHFEYTTMSEQLRAEVSVVDVAANTIARKESGVASGKGVQASAVAEGVALRKVGLSSFGIVAEGIPGRVVYVADTTSTRRPDEARRPAQIAWRGRTSVLRPPLRSGGRAVRLTLQQRRLPSTGGSVGCATVTGGPSGLRLSLSFEGDAGSETLVLQDDVRVPRSRGCALGYSIEQVIVYRDVLSVIVAYETDPVEGVGERIGFIAVTAAIGIPWTVGSETPSLRGRATPGQIPDVIPEIDLNAKATGEADFSAKRVAGGVASGVVGGLVAWKDEPFFDFQVEKPVAPIPGTGAPRYPDDLRTAGVEGEVLAQFVVDTLGRVELGSYKVIRTSHELFAASVRAAVPAMRFMPAEIGGRKVKQLVQQPFVFALQR